MSLLFNMIVSVLIASVAAVKRLDLTASDGEIAGKYAFDGGEPEATCKACKAVQAGKAGQARKA